MAVKIKLKRLGKIREPYYRIVVADARTKRDGRAIEEIGKYHPKAEPSLIEVNSERVQHWLSVGAQPTDPVRVLLKITGDWQKFTGEPGAEGTLRTAEPRADKKERFAAAAKESQARKPRTPRPRKPGKAPRRALPAEPGQGGQARQEQGPGHRCRERGARRREGTPDAKAPAEDKAPADAKATPDVKAPAEDKAPADAKATADAKAADARPRPTRRLPLTRRPADARLRPKTKAPADAKAAAGESGSGA